MHRLIEAAGALEGFGEESAAYDVAAGSFFFHQRSSIHATIERMSAAHTRRYRMKANGLAPLFKVNFMKMYCARVGGQNVMIRDLRGR